MIPIAQTVVNKDAVMIELLDASVTEVTMVCVLWSKSFTRYAHIV